jgi:hypothetical protein
MDWEGGQLANKEARYPSSAHAQNGFPSISGL